VKVKICGIRSSEAALAAADAGADLLGLNFAPVSKRRIAVFAAVEAAGAIRQRSTPPQLAGIFVNQPIDEVARIARGIGLDYVQLSGDEDEAYCRSIASETRLPVIKAVRLPADDVRAAALRTSGAVELLLADAQGTYGGAGQPWKWETAADLASQFPTLLAGGLTAETVGTAIAAVRPWGVDVASGVETNGQTDPEKVRAFIKEVRAYEHSHGHSDTAN
jgi:phosphoribosylanthranilate isomerase